MMALAADRAVASRAAQICGLLKRGQAPRGNVNCSGEVIGRSEPVPFFNRLLAGQASSCRFKPSRRVAGSCNPPLVLFTTCLASGMSRLSIRLPLFAHRLANRVTNLIAQRSDVAVAERLLSFVSAGLATFLPDRLPVFEDFLENCRTTHLAN